MAITRKRSAKHISQREAFSGETGTTCRRYRRRSCAVGQVPRLKAVGKLRREAAKVAANDRCAEFIEKFQLIA